MPGAKKDALRAAGSSRSAWFVCPGFWQSAPPVPTLLFLVPPTSQEFKKTLLETRTLLSLYVKEEVSTSFIDKNIANHKS